MPRVLALLTACVLLAGRVALSQPRDKVEAWGGLSLAAPRLDALLSTSYVPVIERYTPPAAGSTAGQTVTLSGSSAAGFEVGVAYLFREHVGLQVLLGYDRVPLSGDPGPYSVLLNYTAAQPPFTTLQSYTFSSTSPPCTETPQADCVAATSGHVRQLTFAANLVGRWPVAGRVNAEVSGGFSVMRASGTAQPLRYSVFEMGGHATLFSQEYRVAYSVGPALALGIDLGGGIDIGLGRGAALMVDARYFVAPEASAAITVTEVLNRDDLVFVQEPAVVQETLHPPDVKLSLGRARLVVGLKITR